MSDNHRHIDWAEAHELTYKALLPLGLPRGAAIYGVPRGGIPPALLALSMYGLTIASSPAEADVFIDDIVDSGSTRAGYVEKYPGKPFAALVDYVGKPQDQRPWVVFPWEKKADGSVESAEDNVRRLLQLIGENPDREGLRETPKRFVKALRELTRGLADDPIRHLEKRFPLDDAEVGVAYDQIILSGALPFTSLCEHHLLPFTGHAYIGYLPKEGGQVVGLSKLARLLDGYSQRPQVQERLTEQIANAIEKSLSPAGVGVILRASHTCQCLRGVRKDGRMVTSSMRGLLRNDGPRFEFLKLCEFSEQGG